MIKKIFNTTCRMAFGIGVGVGMGAVIWGAGVLQGGSSILLAQQIEEKEEKARKEVVEEDDDTEDTLDEIEQTLCKQRAWQKCQALFCFFC